MEEPCRKLILNNDQLGGLVGRFPGDQYFDRNDGGMPGLYQPFSHLNIGPNGGAGNEPPFNPSCPSIGFNMDYINEQMKYSGGGGIGGMGPGAPMPFDGQMPNPQMMGMDCQRRQQCPEEGIGKLIGGLVDLLGKQGHRGNATVSPKKDPSDKLRNRCDKIGNFLGDAAHRFLGVNPRTGQIIGSIAGNVLFHFGGKDNKLGTTGTIILDNIISGKFRRKIDPFIKPDRISKERPSGPMPPIAPSIYGKEINFYAQRDRCLQQKCLFEDPDFPANDSSLFFSRRPPENVIWLRPGQIVREPQLIVEGHTRFDVIQGKLGNCWLMAAVANLTLAEELFYRVVPPDQSFTQNYAGIFHFQFWQYGRWLDVIVDDRLPCSRNGELLYMHSRDLNEFWSALLEKAYAKLYGSYEALRGGTTGEALEDMTGGLTEFIELEYPPMNLLQMMARGFAMGSLFGCSIEADPYIWEAKLPNGLVKGHAYSITGIRSVPTQRGQQVLLRIRNPWGNDQEWRGPWSDRSSEWRQLSDGLKRDMALHFEHDGEFWMSFEDFVRNFEKLEICHLGPEVLEEIYQMTGIKSAVRQNWSIRIHHGGWRRHQSAGGCRNYLQTFASNPQIRIKIAGPNANAFDEDGRLCTVVIAVMQKFRREKKYLGLGNLAIGFAVYQANSMRGRLGKEFFAQNHSYARSPAFINLREVSARFRMPPGEYVIVPSTFEPNEEGEFMGLLNAILPTVLAASYFILCNKNGEEISQK